MFVCAHGGQCIQGALGGEGNIVVSAEFASKHVSNSRECIRWREM